MTLYRNPFSFKIKPVLGDMEVHPPWNNEIYGFQGVLDSISAEAPPPANAWVRPCLIQYISKNGWRYPSLLLLFFHQVFIRVNNPVKGNFRLDEFTVSQSPNLSLKLIYKYSTQSPSLSLKLIYKYAVFRVLAWAWDLYL